MARLLSIDRTESPISNQSVRSVATFVFDSIGEKHIWFDTPADMQHGLTDRADPWIVLLLPVALELGEDIATDYPVDERLLVNLECAQAVLRSWYDLRRVKIDAPGAKPPAPKGDRTAVFFSGGIDSYYSLMANIGGPNDPDDLLMVWGFDIPLARPEEFHKARELGERMAGHFGKTLLPVATNLQHDLLSSGANNWGPMSHGAALASTAHVLAGVLGKAIIGSTHDYAKLSPWGSHPMLDPYYSSSALEIIHHGAIANRVEKTRLVASDPVALADVRVCWLSKSASNCSQCSKCLRTMVTLDLLGEKANATSFDWSDYSLDKVAAAYLPNQSNVDFALELLEGAQELNRPDIAEAIRKSLRRSVRTRWLDAKTAAMKGAPFLWRYQEALRKALIPN